MRYVVAMTGASGAAYGIRLLQLLQGEKHLVMSETAKQIVPYETDVPLAQVYGMADRVYDDTDMFAPIASGSFRFDAMIIAPCTESTVAKIANGIADTLITRAASVCIKEGRELVLLVRETPKSAIMLENELKLARLNVVIMDANPEFYSRPESVSDIVDIVVGRCLDQVGQDGGVYRRWERSSPHRPELGVMEVGVAGLVDRVVVEERVHAGLLAEGLHLLVGDAGHVAHGDVLAFRGVQPSYGDEAVAQVEHLPPVPLVRVGASGLVRRLDVQEYLVIGEQAPYPFEGGGAYAAAPQLLVHRQIEDEYHPLRVHHIGEPDEGAVVYPEPFGIAALRMLHQRVEVRPLVLREGVRIPAADLLDVLPAEPLDGGHALLPKATMHSTLVPSDRPRIPRTMSSESLPALSRMRTWIQHEPRPRSSASSCIMMAAMEPSSTQVSAFDGSATTATANVQLSRAGLDALQPASLLIVRMSSTGISVSGLLFLEEGARSPASRIRPRSSPFSGSEENLRQLCLDLAISMKLIPAGWRAFRARPAWPSSGDRTPLLHRR